MEHFVTLFDGAFIPQGLALYRSMRRHLDAFTLWVLCVDDLAFDALQRLQLPHVRGMRLADFETEALLAVKGVRSRGEYCWTLTPFSVDFVFSQDDSIARVTYLDADVWFAHSPRRIFEEFDAAGKSVLITPHGYAPEYDQSDATGAFCVQFVVFERTRSADLRRQWQSQCLAWCYARSEHGKFGDQKYLDSWPRDFPDQVHVGSQLQSFQAPWNASRFAPSECCLFHFHGLRLMSRDRVLLSGHYRLPYSTYRILYLPYLDDLAHGLSLLRDAGFQPCPQVAGSGLRLRLQILARRVRHRYREWIRPEFKKLAPRADAS
jgi:hypothetical protein